MKRLIALTTAIALATVAYMTPTGAAAEAPTASTVSTVTNSDVVVDWSRIVFEAAMTDDGFVSFMGTRHQAMMHIAMHDALNAIDPRFDQYAYFGRSKGANPIAAAAKAAHDVLVAVYPAQQATLDAELATWLATVPNGSGKTKALTLGAKAAAAIVALRQNDGTDVDLVSPNYTPGTQPGDYQFVPPYDFAFAEDFRVRDAVRTQVSQAVPRARAPGADEPHLREGLQGGQVGRSHQQHDPHHGSEQLRQLVVRGLRDRLGPRRPRHHDQRRAGALARCPDVRARQHVPLRQLRRGLGLQVPLGLLAALHRDPSRRHRRQPPHRQGRHLEELSRDPAGPGLPLDPQRPRRRSGRGPQAGLQDRSCAVLDGLTTALPANPVRSFNTFTQAANENADSRVRAGIHFRFATEQGKALGRKVGSYIVKHHLQRR